MTLDDVLSRLEDVQRIDDHNAKACCPCHASKSKASLSVKVGDDGRILLHCFGGCEAARVVEAIGLEMRDLMPERSRPPAGATAKSRNPGSETPNNRSRNPGSATAERDRPLPSPSAALDVYRQKLGRESVVHEYHGADGELVGLVARWNTPDGKEIRPVSRNGSGWTLKAMPEPRPLYRLPDVLGSKVVIVVEGEKAADALRKIGRTATTSPGGSKAPGKTDWSPLAGRTVLLWPDADEPGEGYVQAVTDALAKLSPRPTVKRVTMPNANPGDDAFDFIAREGADAANEVSGLVEAATEVRWEVADPPPERLPAAELCSSYPELRPVVIEGLLRRGETANVVSVTKVGKSWLTLNLAIAVANGWKWLGHWTRAGRVLLIDNELHPETLSYRIRTVADAMGTEVPGKLEVMPLRGQLQDVFGIAAALSEVEPGDFALVILDAFYRTLPEGTSENDNAQMAAVFNELDALAGRLGSAVVLVHHSTKGSQGEKRVTDVGSGAGSIARAVDSHIVLREHEEEGVFVLGAEFRSFASINPRCFKREFPLFIEATELDPERLRSSRPSKSDTVASRDERMFAVVDQQQNPKSTSHLSSLAKMNNADGKASLIRLHDAGRVECWHHGERVEEVPGSARALHWLASDRTDCPVVPSGVSDGSERPDRTPLRCPSGPVPLGTRGDQE